MSLTIQPFRLKQVTLTVGTPPFHLKSPRVTISLLKLNVITHLIIDEDDSDWDGRGRFFPGSWDGDRHASTPTGDGSPRSPLGVFTRSAVSRDVVAEHAKDSSFSLTHRRYSEDHGEKRIDDSRSINADKEKKFKNKEKVKNKEKEKMKEKKYRLKDGKSRARNRSLSRDREEKGGGGGGGSGGDDFQSVPPRQQQSVYIAVQQVPYLILPYLILPYLILSYLLDMAGCRTGGQWPGGTCGERYQAVQ